MQHGSLFSGIGGFDLAATWMGWRNVFNCEKDPFCRKVLQHYWPEAVNYEDVCQFNAAQYRGSIDIISGGFPCQPFSTSGRRKGKEDDRYLWPQARRVIEESRPRWIVLENVAGLFSILEPQGLSEMEVKAVELFCADKTLPANEIIIRLQRRVIGTIVEEIASAGYVFPKLSDGTPVLLCIPACALNAPHRRDRVWFVAHADGIGRKAQGGAEVSFQKRQERPGAISPFHLQTDWTDWPTQSPVRGGNDGIPTALDGISLSKWCGESLKAYGNAIVPQIALEIFKIIQQVEDGQEPG